MIRAWLYRRLPTFGLAVRNIDRTTSRSALATLGVVIGVVAIASLGMFGTALETSATQNLGDIGSEVAVTAADDEVAFGPGGGLDRRQFREIRRIADGTVVPVKQTTAPVRYQGERVGVQLMWVPDATSRFEAQSGEMPSTLRSGVLVGSRAARRYGIQAGNAISVDGRTFRVEAVLASEGFTSELSPDFALVLPESQFAAGSYSTVVVQSENATVANRTATDIRNQMNRREEVVEVQGGDNQFQEQVSSFYSQVNTFLLGIGGISLIVAGVSILNVMLMSTVERREEIGVMRAVGFLKRDVLKVMLSEAVLLGLLGGAVGVVLSLLVGTVLYATMLGDPLMVLLPANVTHLVRAFGFAIGTSLLSGAYPAWKAANERPVEALRS